MSKPASKKDVEALASFFAVWWAVVVLAPRDNQAIRSYMAKLGFVEKRGPLALTQSGKRVLAIARGIHE